jgi:polysaccharide export outer membrane protein
MTNTMNVVAIVFLFSAALSPAQPDAPARQASNPSQLTRQVKQEDVSSAITLGAGDELTLAAPEIEELDKRILRVQGDGMVSVPLVGRLKAAGLTPRQFQLALTDALKVQFRNPQISFTSIDLKSKSVSILGAVNKPGVEEANGQQSLLEMLSRAGGIRKDAGYVIKVTRASTSASTFPAELRPTLSGDSVTAEIPISSLFDGKNPALNVTVLPGDVITVPKGKLIYVVGNVVKAGGFVVGQSDDLTVLRALALAEGLQPFADTGHARILRAVSNGPRVEQVVDVKKVMQGKSEDVRLQPDDILFIPNSTAKKVTARSIETALQVGVGFAIWR